MDRKKIVKAVIPIALTIILALIPTPQGLTPKAWYYFAVFAGVVAGMILEPVPVPVVCIIGLCVAAAFGLVAPKPGDSVKWALSGFASSTAWLVFAAFMFAAGYEKSGLGRRISLLLVKALGKKTLGLGYAVALSDLVLSPFVPSNSARSGGTIYPIIKNIPPLYGSAPGETARKVGAYIMWTALATTCVTSSMVLTGLAPNILALEIVGKVYGVTFSWKEWFLGFLPVGVILFSTLPLLIYWIYPPEIKSTEGVGKWAGDELIKMGKISRNEKLMGLLASSALILWIFGGEWFDNTTTALMVLMAMIVFRVIDWNDFISNKAGWNVFVFLASLISLADGLRIVGFLKWFATATTAATSGLPMTWVMILLVVVFFYAHYMFGSISAHTSALLPVFLAAAMTVPGMPLKPMAMLFCYTLGIMGILTPYATGPSPIYYGTGFIKPSDFWKLGFIFGVIFLGTYLLIGIPYLEWYLK
jgi:L-tartrate/succinate antiporter